MQQVKQCCYSWVEPTPAPRPELVVVSDDAAAELGLTTADISADPTTIAALAGTLPATSRLQPYAACYGGHQFGSFAGQLGDGRAISLGEVLTAADDRWELQLKGAESVGPRVSALVGLGTANVPTRCASYPL